MRIIAGSKRGMKLFCPKIFQTRPITDRVKESLFDVLYNYDLPEGKVVADLFSGVGSLGLEALSRGAEFATFVENEPVVFKILNRNLVKAGFVKGSKTIRANAFKVGAPVVFAGRKYELVFVDPPYAKTREVGKDSLLGRLLAILSGQLEKDALVVVRTSKETELLKEYGRLKVAERREWGTMAVTMLRCKKDDE